MMAMLDENFSGFSGSMPRRIDSRDTEREHLLTFLKRLSTAINRAQRNLRLMTSALGCVTSVTSISAGGKPKD
jgi:predicted alpha/beta hydrolase family esterase